MSRDFQRGEGKLKTIITLLVLAALILAAVRIVPVYVSNYELEDAMKGEARFAMVNRKSPEDVRETIYKKIKELGIPAERDAIRIEQLSGGAVRITVTYSVVVDLVIYKLELNFKPTADHMSV